VLSLKTDFYFFEDNFNKSGPQSVDDDNNRYKCNIIDSEQDCHVIKMVLMSLPHDAIHSTVNPVARYLSVHLSVCHIPVFCQND